MRLLLVAATDLEVAPLRTALAAQPDVQVVVTGVGMVATAARVARALSRERFELALNVGVCGALDRGLPLHSATLLKFGPVPRSATPSVPQVQYLIRQMSNTGPQNCQEP